MREKFKRLFKTSNQPQYTRAQPKLYTSIANTLYAVLFIYMPGLSSSLFILYELYTHAAPLFIRLQRRYRDASSLYTKLHLRGKKVNNELEFNNNNENVCDKIDQSAKSGID